MATFWATLGKSWATFYSTTTLVTLAAAETKKWRAEWKKSLQQIMILCLQSHILKIHRFCSIDVIYSSRHFFLLYC